MGLISVVTCLLLVLVAAVAQPAVAHFLSIGGVYPDFAVASVLVVALFMGPQEGIGIGLVAGLIAVTQVGHAGIAGVILSRSAAGAVGGVVGARFYRQSAAVQMAAVAAGVLAAEVSLFLFAPDPLVGRWLACALGKAFITGLHAPILYRLVNRVASWESGERYRYMPLR
jgi:hypothetical protein